MNQLQLCGIGGIDLSATIENLDFSGKIVLDYTQKPLRKAELKDFRISYSGEIKIEIGALRDWVNKAVSVLANGFKREITEGVQPQIQKLLSDSLNDKQVLEGLQLLVKNI